MPMRCRAFRFLCSLVIALGTVAIMPPSVADAGGAWSTFEDPRERAFTFDVPRDWTAKGGMFRVGYADYRAMVEVRSPDGAASVRFGDVAVPVAYALPTAQHPADGEVDDLGAQAQLVYARYRGGKDYARLYALTRLKRICRQLTPEATTWTPPPPAGLPEAKSTDGAVAYRCDSGEGARIAYVYAQTAPASPGLWHVVSLLSFIAPPDQLTRVHDIIARAAQTLRSNPAWIAQQKRSDDEGLRYQVARQRRRIADLGTQVQHFETQMRGMQDQVRAFERGQASQAGQVAAFGNALTGITPAVDPLNGQTRDVWTGPANGYWINGVGTIVNSNGSPGAGYRQLQPL